MNGPEKEFALPFRHSRARGNPRERSRGCSVSWSPAFAGMTMGRGMDGRSDSRFRLSPLRFFRNDGLLIPARRAGWWREGLRFVQWFFITAPGVVGARVPRGGYRSGWG